MSYLPRVRIVEFRVGAPGGNLQDMMIMEWEDSKGHSFTPLPPTPPSDTLTVTDPTETSGSTVLGSTLTGTPATYTGGKPPIVIQTRWERSNDGLTDWDNVTEWTVDGPTTYTTVAADDDKYLRFHTQATDSDLYVAGSFGNAVGPMTPDPIVIQQSTKISNGTFLNPPYVYDFETINCVGAVYAGGYGTLTEQYRFQKDTGAGWNAVGGWGAGLPTYNVAQANVGDLLRFQSRATDSVGNTKISNSPATEVGVATTLGTVTIDPQNATVDPASTTTLEANHTGTATNIMYLWEIRNGPGQITSPTNFAKTVDVEATGQPGASIQVQCTLSDQSSSDSPIGSIATLVIQ